MERTKIHRSFMARLLAATALGLLCAWLCFAVENLTLPLWLQTFLQPVYRVVFFVGLVPRALLRVFVYTGEVGRHFNPSGPISFFLAPFLVWAGWEIVMGARRLWRARNVDAAPDPGRRLFVAQGAVAVVGVGAAGWGAHSTLVAPQRVTLVPYEIPIADLPAAFDGLRIAHISDTHYGPYITLDYLHDVIDRVNAEEPDVVFLTGDYVHRTPNAIRDGIGIFEGLRPRLGIAATLGNHDHWEDADACRKRFAEVGIPLLDNANRFLSAKGLVDRPSLESICIGGVGDLWEDEVSPEKALAGASAAMPRIVLSHNPDVAEDALSAGQRVDLQLSGHTHGGQVRLPGWGTIAIPSRYGRKYAGGLVEGPHFRVLISRGVGLAAVPIRVGVPPEVPIITLRA